MTALDTYQSLNPLYSMSKADIQTLAEKQIEEINDSGSAEQAFAFLHKLSTLCDAVKKGIMDSTLNEIDKGNDSAFGLKMKKASKSTYDYSNDAKHVKLNVEIKEREKLLKALKEKFPFLDEETGEIIYLHPPIKKYSTFIKTEF